MIRTTSRATRHVGRLRGLSRTKLPPGGRSDEQAVRARSTSTAAKLPGLPLISRGVSLVMSILVHVS